MKKIFTKDEKKIVVFLAFFLFLGVLLVNAGKLINNTETESDLNKKDSLATIIKKSNTIPKININKADIETLQELKGIGPKTALKIFNFREENGNFASLKDLTRVKGIGRKTLKKLLPYLEIIGDSADVYNFVNSSKSSKQVSENSIININTAGTEELKSLYRIGEVTAQKIIDYRKLNGPFKAKEDIMQIKGIGSGTYEKIKNRIRI